jgi:SOS-response transcriptional repressor LexA
MSREGDIPRRLTELRERVYGPRGRAAFARALGVSPSTYNYYEKGRPAPAGLLARAAEVTGADLAWLMTGKGGPPPPDAAPVAADIGLSHPALAALERFSAGVRAASDPAAGHDAPTARDAAARDALADILARMEQALPPGGAWKPETPAPSPTSIPVLGRTAAGLSARWEAFFEGDEDPDVLHALLERVEGRPAHRRTAALADADPQREASRPARARAVLTQLAEPTPDGLVEFLDLAGVAVEPGTFALRVDGDSMAPRLADGDLVVTHRRAPPQPGCTAIVKIRGRVGVTVKLWRPEGDRVHLIPINETYPVMVEPRDAILWASRVLWVVRL